MMSDHKPASWPPVKAKNSKADHRGRAARLAVPRCQWLLAVDAVGGVLFPGFASGPGVVRHRVGCLGPKACGLGFGLVQIFNSQLAFEKVTAADSFLVATARSQRNPLVSLLQILRHAEAIFMQNGEIELAI